ncbi:MAG: hypothetical protein NC430_12635 [bacterium]|nr:hypothetical protein [bacterium]MCM1424619.1 hypothetical protein [bacterium]
MFVVKKPHKKANVPKTIRFTEELNRQIEALALKSEVSFNELVIQCCQYALDQYDWGGREREQE